MWGFHLHTWVCLYVCMWQMRQTFVYLYECMYVWMCKHTYICTYIIFLMISNEICLWKEISCFHFNWNKITRPLKWRQEHFQPVGCMTSFCHIDLFAITTNAAGARQEVGCQLTTQVLCACAQFLWIESCDVDCKQFNSFSMGCH